MMRSAVEVLTADQETPSSWRDLAACLGADPDLFFREQGQSLKPGKLICAACDVRAECRDYAIANRIDTGIWGGLAYRERRKIWQQRRAETVTASAVSLAS